MYLKYTCNSSTLAQSDMLKYIFSWNSALFLKVHEVLIVDCAKVELLQVYFRYTLINILHLKTDIIQILYNNYNSDIKTHFRHNIKKVSLWWFSVSLFLSGQELALKIDLLLWWPVAISFWSPFWSISFLSNHGLNKLQCVTMMYVGANSQLLKHFK